MPSYDADFASPPAPVARVTVRNATATRSVTDVPLLIDTGADATLIPRAILPFLDILEEALVPSGYWLVGFDGTRSPAVLVPAEIDFMGKRLTGEYLLAEADYGVLGRDVLNLFRIAFDGRSRCGTNSMDDASSFKAAV